MHQTICNKTAMLCYFFIIFLQYTGWKTLIGFIQKSDISFP